MHHRVVQSNLFDCTTQGGFRQIELDRSRPKFDRKPAKLDIPSSAPAKLSIHQAEYDWGSCCQKLHRLCLETERRGEQLISPFTIRERKESSMLTVHNLHKSYQVGKTTYEVLKGVSLEVGKGEFVAVMGPSGSGKTTLLNCISCYIPADSGEITLGNRQLAKLDETALASVRNKQLGFVFQDFLLLDGLTVQQNILLPAIIGGTAGPAMEQRADQLCQVFGISAIREKYPAEISGGEKQRTAVARALINNPLLILADEPTGNLDSKSSRAVISSFEQAKQSLEATIFMVTHDSFAASFCDRVIILQDGVVWRVLEKGTLARTTFQDQLLDAIREMGRE